ncbi:MAG TPA: hypothetical protein VFR80_11465, partial [Pyrinomonadaceae bacterium]|nr:hypothetical protein [Pyrinomonadaceae bacterium]
KKTDTGRAVYGGGGIAPDEVVNAKLISPGQRRLVSPIFAFSRELVNGRINGFDNYRVQQAIVFDHDLQTTDFGITDQLFRAFKEFVASDPNLKNVSSLIQANRPFVELQLRFNIVTAAYGRVMADRVFVTGDDQQVARAIEVVPRARDLAMSARQRTQP